MDPDIDLTPDRILRNENTDFKVELDGENSSELDSIFTSIRNAIKMMRVEEGEEGEEFDDDYPEFKEPLPWEQFDTTKESCLSLDSESDAEYAERVGVNLCCEWLQTGTYKEYKNKLRIYHDIKGTFCERCGKEIVPGPFTFSTSHMCDSCLAEMRDDYEYSKFEEYFRDVLV